MLIGGTLKYEYKSLGYGGKMVFGLGIALLPVFLMGYLFMTMLGAIGNLPFGIYDKIKHRKKVSYAK